MTSPTQNLIKILALAKFKVSPKDKAYQLMTLAEPFAHKGTCTHKDVYFRRNCIKIAILICNEVIDSSADDGHGDSNHSLYMNIYYHEVKKELNLILKIK